MPYTCKMANLSGNSQIIGSGSTSSSPVNLTLGSGLQISGTRVKRLIQQR